MLYFYAQACVMNIVVLRYHCCSNCDQIPLYTTTFQLLQRNLVYYPEFSYVNFIWQQQWCVKFILLSLRATVNS